VAFLRAMRQPAFRKRVHIQLLAIPVVGALIRTADSARLAGTLAILSRSGVPLVEALGICTQVVGNIAIRESVADATRQVREGGSLSKALERSGWFSPMLVQMIASGEQSGELEQMLLRAADYQERNLASSVQAMVNLLGPVMLLAMAGVVMLVVLSVILPMLNLNSFAT
ncbi:MAG: type II secretion system F family protein, partial [Alcanivoracaceae bacterium]